jgi:hypothetical protein
VETIFRQQSVEYNLFCMAGFEHAWAAVSQPRDGQAVSPDLKPLLHQVYLDFQSIPVPLKLLKEHLAAVLEYLTEGGRTNANCWAVDLFFCVSDDIGWEKDWTDADLPDDLHDVFDLIGQALHDTVSSPDIAWNFDCLPEQLLERLRRVSV